MSRRSPYDINLSVEEELELKRRAVKYTLPYYQVVRAQMILMAAEGMENDEIAIRLNTQRQIVSRWRKRFFYERLEGLEERPRPGRPHAASPQTRGKNNNGLVSSAQAQAETDPN